MSGQHCDGSASIRREPVHIKGALHVHSTLSRDGTMAIPDLVQWYRRNHYQFLALGEHAEDLDETKMQVLRQQSAENSTGQFCVIPGIEFVCSSDIHILGIGAGNLISEKDPLSVIQAIHEQGGFAVLAHPKRIGWRCPREVLLALDAAEIWNVGYDGKYLPSAQAVTGFRRMKRINGKLLGVASHDFHRTGSFYDVAIEMDVAVLSPDAILRSLREGCYGIRSLFFRADPQVRLSRGATVCLQLLSWQLNNLRRARLLVLRGAQ